MTHYMPERTWAIHHDYAPRALEHLAPGSVHAAVCSPPYFRKRDYDPTDPDWLQLGQEDQPEDYVTNLANCFDPLLTVLDPEGCLFVNIGDTYAGSGGSGGDYNEGGLRAGQPGYTGSGRRSVHRPDPRLGHDRIEGGVTGRRGHGTNRMDHHKPKDLIGVPWLFAQEMKRRGWWWRDDIIWAKPNPMPEGPSDRTAGSHEYLWLFTPSPTTWWDHYAIQEPARPRKVPRKGQAPLVLLTPRRLRRSVWEIPVSTGYRSKTSGAHYATFPEALPLRCLQAATPEIGVCGTCGARPRRITERDPVTKQLNFRHWELPDCGHPWEPVGATVLDLFNGAGTTGVAALAHGRSYIGIEPVAANVAMTVERIRTELPLLGHAGTVERSDLA